MSRQDAPSPGPEKGEHELVAALRSRDETAFRTLVNRHHQTLLRLARLYVPDSVADEVVQETWMAVIEGLDRFQARSSLKTWIFRILVNQARKRGPKERRSIPFATAGPAEDYRGAVDPDLLVHPELGANYWPAPPPAWRTDPASRAVDSELRKAIANAVFRLSDAQREVITLRDVEGWTSEEVCEALGISAVNQRTLLHRARTGVRRTLEEYLHAK